MKQRIHNICSGLRYALLTGALLVAGTSLVFQPTGAAQDRPEPAPLNLVVEETPINRDQPLPASFSPVVKRVAPSVVKVFTTTRVQQPNVPEAPFFDDPLFRRFFGDQFRVDPRQRNNRDLKQYGLGSGVIVTSNGYMLSNNHVVANADEVKVALADGREFSATVIGSDPKTEIAVLKIDATDLPYIKLADSDLIEVGDMVLAVGNPFGIGQTVTMGMVSATGRATRDLVLDYQDFIQTDAPINPGNSGGALIDLEGRLIGINTAILSRSGGNLGIGFAVPINLARSVMESLIEHGRVIRGFLGVFIQDVSPDLAKQFDLDEPRGSIVTETTPDSPAGKAGIRAGDVITEFNGKPIKDTRELKLEVGKTAPGKKVPVQVIRDGKSRTMQVTLEELPENDGLASNQKPRGTSDERLKGVTVGDIDTEARSQYEIPRRIQGALVLDVERSSPAFEAGLRPGDVILEIEHEAVKNADEAVKRSEQLAKDATLLRIWSGGGTRYLVVDESKKR